MATDVIVVGGGVVGASAAYELVCAGATVTVIDSKEPGEATAAAAGILSPGNRFNEGGPILPLVRASLRHYAPLLERLADDGETNSGYEVIGALQVARSEEEARQLPELLQQLRERHEAGFSHIGDASIVSGDQASTLCPILGSTYGAVLIPDVARVDGRELRDTLKRAACKRGAVWRTGRAAFTSTRTGTALQVDGECMSSGKIVVAAGAWSRSLLAGVGREFPVYPQRGQIVHARLTGTDTSRWPALFGFHAHYLVTFPIDRIVVGATREPNAGYDYHATVAGVHEVLDEALRLAPGLAASAIEDVRVGFRPTSADEMPFIGKLPGHDNVYIVTGHGGYGLQVGPFSGALIARIIEGNPMSLDIASFAVARTAAGTNIGRAIAEKKPRTE